MTCKTIQSVYSDTKSRKVEKRKEKKSNWNETSTWGTAVHTRLLLLTNSCRSVCSSILFCVPTVLVPLRYRHRNGNRETWCGMEEAEVCTHADKKPQNSLGSFFLCQFFLSLQTSLIFEPLSLSFSLLITKSFN